MNWKDVKRYEIPAIILLFICVGTAFFIAYQQISHYATESCFRKLHQSTQEFCRELNSNVEKDRLLLQQYADKIAGFDAVDSKETKELLSAFVPVGSVIRLEILFPDDRILSADGTFLEADGQISFTDKRMKGCHISRRAEDLDGSGRMILRYFIPIEKEGHVKALLYGVIDLEKVPQPYAVKEYHEKANLYVIEGTSGDFLVDTLHKNLGNIHELKNRPVKDGFTTEQAINDMKYCMAGRTAFKSFTTDEYLYCDYAPANINDWMVMFSLPKSIAMAEANQILLVIYILAAVEALCLFIYFAWWRLRMKWENEEKSYQLNRVQYMLDIEGTLFGAARNPELVETALQKVAKMLTAQGAFLLLCNGLQKDQVYVWLDGGVTENDRRLKNQFIESFISLGHQLQKGEFILSYNPEEMEDRYGLPQDLGIQNMMLVPVLDEENRPMGILGAANMQYCWKNADLLDSVLLGFSLAANNIENFRLIRELGMIDHLTGLRNRNCFQEAMESFEKDPDYSLSCIYLDADGLHELNNRCGHAAGDKMLRTVAKYLKELFGPEYTFRIGGDEFVAFCIGRSDSSIDEDIKYFKQALFTQGYHISLGVESRHNVPLVSELVKQAEIKMYEAKREYYKGLDVEACAREMDQKLEQMVREKRDLEVFRQALASKYRGVYIVDLKLDTMRYIYIPSYFEKITRNSNGKFSTSISIYAGEIIAPAYREPFLEFVDFRQIEKKLDYREAPEFRYQNKDGDWVFLKVYRSPEYTWRTKESVWLFENIMSDVTDNKKK